MVVPVLHIKFDNWGSKNIWMLSLQPCFLRLQSQKTTKNVGTGKTFKAYGSLAVTSYDPFLSWEECSSAILNLIDRPNHDCYGRSCKSSQVASADHWSVATTGMITFKWSSNRRWLCNCAHYQSCDRPPPIHQITISNCWWGLNKQPVRIRARIDPPHPLVCRKRRLNGAVLRMRPEKPRSRVTARVAWSRSLPAQRPWAPSIGLWSILKLAIDCTTQKTCDSVWQAILFSLFTEFCFNTYKLMFCDFTDEIQIHNTGKYPSPLTRKEWCDFYVTNDTSTV
jgi:hypothetical protein